MEQQVRYCKTSDGVDIAYCVEGQGPPVIICANLFESFTVDHLVPGIQDFYDALGRGRTVVRYDPRNVGLSQRLVADVGVEELLLDLEAVIESVGVIPTNLLAFGAGAQRAILYAVRHPDNVDCLALVSGFERTLDLQSEDALKAVAELARTNWTAAAKALVARVNSASYEEALERSYLASADGEDIARMIIANIHTDVSGFLGGIKARTLVAHQTKHDLIPFGIARRMAAGIPGASLAPITGSNREMPLTDFLPAIDAFLPRSDSPVLRRQDGAFRAVLFTDLVRHTEMMSRLGDELGRAVLREHEQITRKVLKSYDGTEVKTMGDGFVASFGSVTNAVDCAIALQRAFASRDGEPLSVRVGLNAGEPIEEDGDLFGATVILASRISAYAAGGEILVSDNVRSLSAGKGFLFADRGEFEAKGFEEPVKLYEVSWRDEM